MYDNSHGVSSNGRGRLTPASNVYSVLTPQAWETAH
jgi:hypothetical protein